MMELPPYGMRAYALFYSRHGSTGKFRQGELDWLVSEPMKKKIFALLLRAGWLEKAARSEYRCVSPEKAVKSLLALGRVPEVLMRSSLPYALCGLSAIEIWSDYSYVQRSFGRSPYFVRVLKKDLRKWNVYLNEESVPHYVGKGSTIGEFVILLPVKSLEFVEKDNLKVIPLKEAILEAEGNYLHSYALKFIKRKYGA